MPPLSEGEPSQCAHGAFVAVGQPCTKCDLEQAQRTIAKQAAVIEELTLGFGYLPQAQAIMRKHGLLDAPCTP
jgi:hypothetical protein